jgi:hypothetical protein
MNLSIPCGNAVCRTPLPPAMEPEQASVIARTVVNGVAAQLAKGTRIFDWASYGAGIAKKGITAFENEKWDDWASEAESDRYRINGLSGREDEPSLDHLMPHLLLPGPHAHRLVQPWTWLMLGHRFGPAACDEWCRPCVLYLSSTWPRLLSESELNERTILNFYAACVASGHMDAVAPRSVTEAAKRTAAAICERELAAARGEDF